MKKTVSYAPGGFRALALQAMLVTHAVAGVALVLGAPQPMTSAGMGMVGLVWGALFVALGVTFPLWFHRAYKNLVAFWGLDVLQTSPVWAALSFWVPFVGVWRPYRVAQEIYARSTPGDDIEVGIARATASRDVMLWWGTWLFAPIMARISDRLTIALWVVSAVFAIRVVRAVEDRQARRAGRTSAPIGARSAA